MSLVYTWLTFIIVIYVFIKRKSTKEKMRLPNVWRLFSIFFILKSATTLKKWYRTEKKRRRRKRGSKWRKCLKYDYNSKIRKCSLVADKRLRSGLKAQQTLILWFNLRNVSKLARQVFLLTSSSSVTTRHSPNKFGLCARCSIGSHLSHSSKLGCALNKLE